MALPLSPLPPPQAMFGDFSLSDFDDAQYPIFGKALIVLYLLTMALLLLNLLIAIMSATYERIGEVSVSVFRGGGW